MNLRYNTNKTTISADSWCKVMRPGAIEDAGYFVKAEWHADDPLNPGKGASFSLTAVHGPKRNGDAIGGSGQHTSPLTDPDLVPAEGWDHSMLARLAEIWRDYHLPGMQAGTPAQTAYLRSLDPTGKEWRKDPRAMIDHETGKANVRGYGPDHYDWARNVLAEVGLQPDPNGPDGEPYSYGSEWLRIEVPGSVLDEVLAFPDADRSPCWI